MSEAPLGEVPQHSALQEQREGKHCSKRIHVRGSGAIPGWGAFPAAVQIFLLSPRREEFWAGPVVSQQSRLSPFLPKAPNPLGTGLADASPPPLQHHQSQGFSSQIGCINPLQACQHQHTSGSAPGFSLAGARELPLAPGDPGVGKGGSELPPPPHLGPGRRISIPQSSLSLFLGISPWGSGGTPR